MTIFKRKSFYRDEKKGIERDPNFDLSLVTSEPEEYFMGLFSKLSGHIPLNVFFDEEDRFEDDEELRKEDVLYFTWPHSTEGITLILGDRKNNQRKFVDFFPFIMGGSEHVIKPVEGVKWGDGVQAHLVADFYGRRITPYDSCFKLHEEAYQADEEITVAMNAFIMTARKHKARKITPNLNPEALEEGIERLRKSDEYSSDDVESIIQMLKSPIDTSGARTIYPLDDERACYHVFQGEVINRKKFEFMEKPALECEMAVLPDVDGKDICIKSILLETAWEGDELPVKGDDIEGVLWLGCFPKPGHW